jgi:hypothetical protein
MRLIAHRGLIYGPNSQLENNPTVIQKTLALGYDVEVDVRYVKGEWFLGHDEAMHKVDFEFLEQPGMWIHAKNVDALYKLIPTNLNFFWHQNDDFTLTSSLHIWTYPGKDLTADSICVLPEHVDPLFADLPKHCFGICSDYVSNPMFKELL